MNGVVAYIGRVNGGPLKLYHHNNDDLNGACNGVSPFVRILSRAECNVSGLPRFENLNI
jgi:hypothetical protein